MWATSPKKGWNILLDSKKKLSLINVLTLESEYKEPWEVTHGVSGLCGTYVYKGQYFDYTTEKIVKFKWEEEQYYIHVPFSPEDQPRTRLEEEYDE